MRNLIVFAAAALAAGNAGAVTLVNGSFEDGTNPGATFITLAPGSMDLTGWTIGGSGVDYIGGYWDASDGNRSLDLSALSAGQISQTLFDTVAGARYRVSFDVSGNPDGGQRTVRLVASVTGGIAEVYSYVVTAANSTSNMLYQTFTYDFVASGDPQDIQFLSLEENPFGPALDNITISQVPEPAAWVLMIAGFGLVGFAARRRRMTTVAA